MSEEETSQVTDLVSDLARNVARRGRDGLRRRLGSTRVHLERRQLQADREAFWIRLGKTAYRLSEQGEVQHPAIDKAVQRIRELQRELDALDAQNASQSLATSERSD